MSESEAAREVVVFFCTLVFLKVHYISLDFLSVLPVFYPFARSVSYCTYHVSVFCVLNDFDKEIFPFVSWPRPSPLLSTAVNNSLFYVRALVISSNDISPLGISQPYHHRVLTWRILYITYVLEPPMN